MDSTLTDADVAALMWIEPLASLDPDRFNPRVSLAGILKNDCRIHNFRQGDIIVREGDYGSSAFLILSGEALVSLESLPPDVLGRKPRQKKRWIESVAQIWKRSRHVESRDYASRPQPGTPENHVGSRTDESGTHIFLHDVPRLIPVGKSVKLESGEIFGEISALTRTPRSASVVANSTMRVLEIRWQGFRELLNRDDSLRIHVEKLYRENSLQVHLRETKLFQHLAASAIEQISRSAIFESYGDFNWDQSFKSTLQQDISERILAEPLIARQGDYVDGLLLVRNGFARLSRRHGDGHQTIAYLGKGQSFGLRELAHNWKTQEQRPWLLSLRAVGHVDVIRIPSSVIESLVLPTVIESQLPPPLPTHLAVEQTTNRRMSQRPEGMDPGLLEFLVEKRMINGTQAMMIDLDRCTRCDDCVRACATTHDNNPRFVRTGQKYDHWMIANACMHCLDPVCMIGCPTGAIGRESESGNVTINDRTCIGCKTCANSCPYNNIQMVEVNDRQGRPIIDRESSLPIVKATKCDLCSDQPGGPACQQACPHEALVRIDLTTPAAVTDWSQR